MSVDDLQQGPREYRATTHPIMGGVVVFFALVLGISFIGSNVLLGLVVFAGGGFLCWSILQTGSKLFLVLDAEKLRFPKYSPPFILRRTDIVSQQRVYSKNMSGIVLRYRKSETELEYIKIPFVYDENRYFRLWFDSLPNAQAIEQAAIVETVKQNPKLGHTPEERVANHATVNTTVQRLGIGLFVLPFAMTIPIPGLFPISVMPYLLTLALLGVAWFVWQHKAVFASDPKLRVGLYASTSTVAGLQCFLSALQVDFLHLDGFMVLMGGVVTGIILELAIGAARGKKESAFALPIVVFALGCAMLVNKDLDRRAPSIQMVSVLEKREASGRSANRVVFALPGDGGQAKEEAVSKEFFNQTKVGGSLCIKIHPGALGLAWFTLHLPSDCQPPPIRVKYNP